MIKILGLTFKDETTLEEAMNELKRRGLNQDHKSVPITYAKEQIRVQRVKEFKLSAQELIDLK